MQLLVSSSAGGKFSCARPTGSLIHCVILNENDDRLLSTLPKCCYYEAIRQSAPEKGHRGRRLGRPGEANVCSLSV